MTTTSDVTTLEERVTRLEAQEEMRRLAHEYCHGLDKRDVDRFEAIWTQDAVWMLGDEVQPQGLEAITAMARDGVWAGLSETHHWTTNFVVEWTDNGPRGTCDVTATVRQNDGTWLRAAATYVDQYVEQDGHWLIARREAHTHFTEPLA